MSLKVRDSVKLPGDIEAQSTITLAKVSVAGGVDKELVARVARLEVKVTGIDSRLGTVEGETEALQLTSAAHTADILALQEGKQDRLTFDAVPTYGSANPVRSGGVYASIQDVMAVAEGRSKSFTVDFATSGNEFFNSQLSSVTASQFVDINGNLCNADSLKVGDIILVVELDVPDRWVGAINDGVMTFYRMETAKVDLSGYYTKPETDQLLSQKVDNNAMSAYATLATNQEISGIKNFLNGFQINGTTVHQDESGRIVFHYGNTAKIKIGQLDTLFSNRVTPDQSNTYDLGRSGVYWRDLYLSGAFKDGTNSLSIADIAAKPNAVDLETVATNMALAYDETTTYAVGDLVIHDYRLYKCKTAISTAETWDSTHWDELNIFDASNDKYFRVIYHDEVDYNSLTDEQIELFTRGCIVRHRTAPESKLFLGANTWPPYDSNPTAPRRGTVYRRPGNGGFAFATYELNPSTKKLTIGQNFMYSDFGNNSLNFSGIGGNVLLSLTGASVTQRCNISSPSLNGKAWPAYPTDLTKQYAFEQDVSTGNLAWNEKLTYSFQVIDPPASTTLTAAEVELFKKGVRINGTFLGYDNPVFFPAKLGSRNRYFADVFGCITTQSTRHSIYCINTDNNKISIQEFNNSIDLDWNTGAVGETRINGGVIKLSGHQLHLQGKQFPLYPTTNATPANLQIAPNGGNLSWKEVINNLAPEYDATATYALGALCMHDGALYQCTTAIATAEAWDATHWTQVKVDDVYADKNYFGFPVLEAPSSTTLTEEQKQTIITGCAIKGSFGNLSNPIFLPAAENGTGGKWGLYLGRPSTSGTDFRVSIYRFAVNSNVITFADYNPIYFQPGGKVYLKQKLFTDFPSDTSKEYVLTQTAATNGPLAWQEKKYGPSVSDNAITELTYEKISVLSLSADKTFTLKAAQTDCIPEYKALITNSGSSAITLMFTGVGTIHTNDPNITLVAGTNSTATIPANTKVEVYSFAGVAILYTTHAMSYATNAEVEALFN